MKSTQTTVKQRVEEVLEIRLMGAEFADIVRHAAAQGWNCGERQLWNYVHKGDEILAKTLERNRTKLVNRHIAQRRALFARCMAVSDYSNARGVLKDEAELLGLYPGNGDELPPPAEPEPDWTPAERARAMIQLCRAHPELAQELAQESAAQPYHDPRDLDERPESPAADAAVFH